MQGALLHYPTSRSQTMYVGIEIGGTKLQIGLGPGDGTLAALWRGPVDAARGGDGIREQLLRETPALLERAGVARAQVHGVGVGFGGPVNDADQTVIKSHQIAGWDGFPLAKWLTELHGWPVALGNDADVAGLAEALFGAGKELSPIFYITIGSGIGGGLIINGEIYRGSGRGAAEIGHLRLAVQRGERLWWPILEHAASGWALEKTVRTESAYLSQADPAVVLGLAGGQWNRITTKHLGDAAEKDDPFAWDFLRPAWINLAEAICHVIALLCPRRIVIGGGLSLMGQSVLFAPLRAFVAERVFEPFAGCYDIVPAALGEEVVVHGALALARKRFGG
jgi:glucokinase